MNTLLIQGVFINSIRQQLLKTSSLKQEQLDSLIEFLANSEMENTDAAEEEGEKSEVLEEESLKEYVSCCHKSHFIQEISAINKFFYISSFFPQVNLDRIIPPPEAVV